MKIIKLMGAVVAAALTVLSVSSCDLEVREKLSLPSADLGDIEVPYSRSGKIITDSKVSYVKGINTDTGVSISYYVQGGCASDWGMIIVTQSGNIGGTCLHYKENSAWKANAWYKDATNTYGKGYTDADWDAYKNAVNSDEGAYVTITLDSKSDSISWYLNGNLYVTYNSGRTAKDAAFPDMSEWIDSMVKEINMNGFTINPSDSWANQGNAYKVIKDLSVKTAMTAEEAKAAYEAYSK